MSNSSNVSTGDERQKVTFTFSVELDRPLGETGKAMAQEIADGLRALPDQSGRRICAR